MMNEVSGKEAPEPGETARAAETRQTRAEIDNLTVKSLLTINGGGAVAILAFLPVVFEERGLEGLFPWILGSLLALIVGLGLAVLHNHLRRRCSEAHQFSAPDRRKDDNFPVCLWSWRAMRVSGGCFVLAGLLVVLGGAITWWTELR